MAVKDYVIQLSNLPGVSGREKEVREYIKKELGKYCQNVEEDSLGNVIARIGKGDFKIMVAAHMDEIGMAVKYIDEKGFIKFTTIGGIFDQTLLNQRVVVHTRKGKIVGVIGCKPPHLMKDEERKKAVEVEDMFIDVGAKDRKNAEKMGIEIGNPVTIMIEAVEMANNKLTGKAFDNRVGCAVLLELAKKLSRKKPKATIYFVATTQEEVGLKGARVAAFRINPDIALAIDTCVAGDHPGVKEEEAPVKMGKGPAITLIDGGGYGLIAPEKLVDAVKTIAEKKKIPYQLEVAEGGTTDATIINLTREGIPATTISIPARYIHSPVEMIDISDAENAVKLLEAVVENAEELKRALS